MRVCRAMAALPLRPWWVAENCWEINNFDRGKFQQFRPVIDPGDFIYVLGGYTYGRFEAESRVVVPDHKQARLGTLRRIIADAGLTVEQFVELLRL